MTTAFLVLAAGASRRFGADDKLLTRIDGKPMLAHVLDLLRAYEGPHFVTGSTFQVHELARPRGFDTLEVPPGSPQSTSLRIGMQAVTQSGARRCLILLGDMPFVPQMLIRSLLDMPTDRVACAEGPDGIAMPPALFPRALFATLMAQQGDRGAGALLRDVPPSGRVRADLAALRDIDRPEDLPPTL